jgi:hypothetical protein
VEWAPRLKNLRVGCDVVPRVRNALQPYDDALLPALPAQAKETALFGLREAGSGVRKLRAGRAMILPDWFWVS